VEGVGRDCGCLKVDEDPGVYCVLFACSLLDERHVEWFERSPPATHFESTQLTVTSNMPGVPSGLGCDACRKAKKKVGSLSLSNIHTPSQY
jgi:hypothetical protein